MPSPPRWRAMTHPASAGLALIAVATLPPVETLARQYLFVESIQFCVLSMAGPALIVLGAPWRVLRLSREPGRREPGRKATSAVVRQGRGLPRLVGRRLPLLAAAAGS